MIRVLVTLYPVIDSFILLVWIEAHDDLLHALLSIIANSSTLSIRLHYSPPRSRDLRQILNAMNDTTNETTSVFIANLLM